MLLMIAAQAAIVWTTIVNTGIKAERRFRWLVIVTDVFVVFYIGSDDYLMKSMVWAGLQHVHLAILKNYFGVYAFQAFRAQADSEIIIGIFSNGHKRFLK